MQRTWPLKRPGLGSKMSAVVTREISADRHSGSFRSRGASSQAHSSHSLYVPCPLVPRQRGAFCSSRPIEHFVIISFSGSPARAPAAVLCGVNVPRFEPARPCLCTSTRAAMRVLEFQEPVVKPHGFLKLLLGRPWCAGNMQGG